MDQQLRKWVLASYIGASALLGYVVYNIAFKFVNIYDLEARIRNIDIYTTLLAAAIGVICFSVLTFHGRVNEFMNDVVLELSKVTWPTVDETQKSTFIVVIMVLICGAFLGAVDAVTVWLLKFIL